MTIIDELIVLAKRKERSNIDDHYKSNETKTSKKKRKKSKQQHHNSNENILEENNNNNEVNNIIKKKRKSKKKISIEIKSIETLNTITTNTYSSTINKGDNNDSNNYPYKVMDDDHCETPREAYDDICFLLDTYTEYIHKKKSDILIYDPYYCEGAMSERMKSLGYDNVYNKKEDFYDMIQHNKVPNYDILITNPPYSLDHIERLILFCVQTNKPWMLLLPNYVYRKDYYLKMFDHHRHNNNNNNNISIKPFYITPTCGRRYLYTTPKGRRQVKSNKYTSPFPTFWYCYFPTFPTLLHIKERKGTLLDDKKDYHNLHSKLQSILNDYSKKIASDGDITINNDKNIANSNNINDNITNNKKKALKDRLCISTSMETIPIEIAPDNDPRKKKLRNNLKRSKNKKRKKEIILNK